MRALADELKNISRACQVAGISRTHFYDIKDACERYGRDGLAPQERRRPRMPNETPMELVARILEMTAEYPTHSYVRVSQQLRLIGVPARAAQVRGVWAREGLVKRFDRLRWLERVLTANGREYWGRPLHHPFELYCAVQQIEHRTTGSARRSRTGWSSASTEPSRRSSSASPTASACMSPSRRCRRIWTAS
jgi:hypothetical protein